MNGFQHLPEYQSAARSYRLERTVVERSPRRTTAHPHPLRRLMGALAARRATTPTVPAVPAAR